MKTYPIMLNLSGRKVVVVGAGPVGLRKARSLSDAGAEVKLVAERVGAEDLPPAVQVVRERYRDEHLAGAALVLACTNDGELNSKIADDARRLGALVNVADDPEHCDFYLPAAAADGDVVIAAGTGGASPALAAALKKRLAAALPERIGAFAAALARARGRLKAAVADGAKRKEILRRLAGEDVYRAFIAGGEQAVLDKMESLARET